MPYLTIYTNVEPKDGMTLAKETSALTAQVLHKPESYVVTNIIHNPMKRDADGIWRLDWEDMERKITENRIHAAIFCNPPLIKDIP